MAQQQHTDVSSKSSTQQSKHSASAAAVAPSLQYMHITTCTTRTSKPLTAARTYLVHCWLFTAMPVHMHTCNNVLRCARALKAVLLYTRPALVGTAALGRLSAHGSGNLGGDADMYAVRAACIRNRTTHLCMPHAVHTQKVQPHRMPMSHWLFIEAQWRYSSSQNRSQDTQNNHQSCQGHGMQ